MAQATLNSSPALTVADLLEQLGDIPPYRVRLRPPPGLATEADVIEIDANENRRFELVDGVLVEKAVGFYESYLAGVLIHLLASHLDIHNLGVVTVPDGTIRLAPGLVRMPDVAFTSWARLPGGEIPADPIPTLAPDLAVEVLSASNTEREMDRKRDEYFRAGVREVWLVDPPSRTVRIYKAGDLLETLGETDIIDGGEILPGLNLPVRAIFARRPGRPGDPEAEPVPPGT